MGRIDNRPGGRLHTESNQAANGSHQSHRGLTPTLLSDEEYVEVWTEAPAHVGQKKVQGIEGARTKPRLRRVAVSQLLGGSDSGSRRGARGALPGGSCLTDSPHSDSSRSSATRIAFYRNWTNEL